MAPDKKKIAADCFKKGTEAANKENYDYAVEMISKSVALVPDNLLFRQTLRGCEKRMYRNNGSGARMAGVKLMGIRGQIKKARLKEDWAAMDQACEEGLKVNPWDAQLNADLGEACHRLGYGDIATFAYQAAVEQDAANVEFRRKLALILEERGNYSEAIAHWRRIYKDNPDDGEARTKLTHLEASAVMDRGGYEEAKSIQDVREKPEEPVIQSAYDYYRPTSRQQQPVVDGPGMSVEADLQRAIRKEPAAVENYLKLADYYKREKKLQDALATFQQALEVSGGDHSVREQMEDVELLLLRENLEIARQRAASAQDEQAARKNVAELHKEFVKREIEVYSARVQRYPKDSQLKFELARRFMQFQKFAQAIPLLQQASADARFEIEVAVALGECFNAEKKPDLARRQFERIVGKIDPHDKPEMYKKAHYFLGRIAEDAGRRDLAEQHYNDILAVDYEYRDVLSRLEQLQAG